MDWSHARPSAVLRPFVSTYIGYRAVRSPGLHRGLPSGGMTFIVSLADDIRVLEQVDARQVPGAYGCVIAGLHTRPAVIARGGLEEGLAVALTPLGSRALLGCPARELAHLSVEGTDVLGGLADELRERLAGVTGWRARFAIADHLLVRASDPDRVVDPRLAAAWRALQQTHGAARVEEVATSIGWSRRHLSEQFRDEFGLTPKAVARTFRFGRAVALLQRDPGRRLVDVAASAGYHDQSHLTREFRELAGISPRTWIAEEFPSVQDRGLPDGQDRASTHEGGR